MRSVVLSCGVLLLNERDELFLAHATGSKHWDIPKGLAEPGESPECAARRETLEETSIDLSGILLEDLGRHPYRPGKDLHLFAVRLQSGSLDLDACRCTSFYRHRIGGHAVPEADAFRWAPFDEVPGLCARSMSTLLTGQVDLRELAARLPPSRLRSHDQSRR